MKTHRAFTLIELLVVIAIIAILAAILFPVFGKSAMKGKETQSMNNLKQWASALNSELADNDNRMPFDGDGSGGDAAMDDPESWFNMLPVYFHDKPLNFVDNVNKPPRPGDKSVWVNPAVPKTPYNNLIQPPQKFLFSYAMNTYLSSTAGDKQGSSASISNKRMKMNAVENLAATVFMAEKADNKSSLEPSEILAFFGDGDPTTDQNNQAHFLFCDGHVELRKRSNFDPNVMKDTADDPGPTSTTNLSRNFTYVPFLGAQK
jgi:prepilin-type N-terminal cleavage/methylation domain-containing protein/prepilin-type processing-associated H-X9-DG protein